MALKGDLSNVNLGDIFQTLAMNLQEGVLVITSKNCVKKVYFKDGQIALIDSRNKRGFRLGDRLISLGRLSPNDLNAALVRQKSTGTPLGSLLIQMNLAAPEDIEETLRFQAEEEIYDIFTWKNAHFEFVEGPPEELVGENQDIAGIFFNVSGVIMEAARRMDEWELIRRDIPDIHQIFVLIDTITPEEEGETDWLALRVLQLMDGVRSVADIADATCYSAFDLSKILCQYIHAGRIRLADAPELERALEALSKEKEVDRALRVVGQLLALGGEQLSYLEQAAELSQKAGKFEDAAHYLLAIAAQHEANGDLDAAEKCARRALKLDLRSEETHELLLVILSRRGEWDQFVAQALKAADLAAKAGAYERARELLEQAAENRPEDLQVASQLANIDIKLNRKEDAVERLKALLEHLNPKKDRRRIEVICEKIIKLGFREPSVMKRLQRAQQSRRASTKKRLVLAATLVPAIALAGFLFDFLRHQRAASSLLNQAQQAFEDKNYISARNTLRELARLDPDENYCPERGELERSVSKKLHDQFVAVENLKIKENKSNLEAANDMVTNGDYAGAVEQYLKLGTKNKSGRWFQSTLGQLAGMQQILFDELTRLQRARSNLRSRVEQLGKGPKLLEAYDALLSDPVKERTLELSARLGTFKGPKKLLEQVDTLKRPIQKLIAFFEDVYKDRQVHEAVIRKEELYKYVNREWIAAKHAFDRGDLIEAKRRLANIINSSYSQKPLAEIKEFLAEVDRIIELSEETNNPAEMKRLEQLFARARKTLARYPQLDSKMKLPLQIKTKPLGARVFKNGKLLGTADPSLNLSYQRDSKAVIEIRLAGFAPLRRSLENNREWIWEITLVREVVRSWNIGGKTEASPTFDGAAVYVPCRDGRVYVIDPKKTGFAQRLDTKSIGGCSAPAVVDGRELYFPVQEGALHAFDLSTWKPRWSKQMDEAIYAAPALSETTVIVATKAGAVQALDRATGDLIWTYRAEDQVRGAPVVSGNRVYVASFDQHVHAIDLETGRPVWKFAAEAVLEAAPVVDENGTIYAVDRWRYLYAIEPEQGSLVWKAKVGGAAATPVLHGSDVLIATTDKGVQRVRRTDGSVITSYDIKGLLRAPPLIAGDRLYQGTKDGHLWVFDLSTGQVLWSYETGGAILTTPLAVGDYVMVVSTDRRAYMFHR